MRSRVQQLRFGWQLTLVLVMSMCSSGCQIGRTFFQMDSDSPVPFMGVNLLPKLERESPTAGVSRFQNENVTDVSSESPSSDPTEEQPGRLTRLLGRSTPSESLSLPSSEVAENEAPSMTAPVEEFR